jgi:hypothetical protein
MRCRQQAPHPYAQEMDFPCFRTRSVSVTMRISVHSWASREIPAKSISPSGTGKGQGAPEKTFMAFTNERYEGKPLPYRFQSFR